MEAFFAQPPPADQQTMSDFWYTQWLREWQGNDPERVSTDIPLYCIRNSGQAAQFARAFRENEFVTSISFDLFSLEPLPNVNWDPLLQELATREMLETVVIVTDARAQNRDNPLLRLFRERFLPAFQRNSNLRSLCFCGFEFSISAAEGFVSFLRSAPNLTDLKFQDCSDSNETKHIATVLQRNTNIQTLCFDQCDEAFLVPIFQKLAYPESTSQLTKIIYMHGHRDLPPTAPLTEAMQQYFESGNATASCFEVDGCIFGQDNGLYNLVFDCLMHGNTPVNDISFNECGIDHDYEDDLDRDAVHVFDEENAMQVVNFVRSMRSGNVGKVSTLRVTRCNFFWVEEICNAVTELLVHPQSTLRVFAFSIADGNLVSMPLAKFRDTMAAAVNSTRLQHLLIHCIQPETAHFQELKTAIPSFKFKELTLSFDASLEEGDEEEQLLEAFRRNYSLQNIECKSTENHWFSEQNQSRLDFYLHRNRKLAEWVGNPKLVPRELWSYAIMLALKAGKDCLYQSLLSLSEHGIASQQGKRKRKRRQLYDPSPKLVK